MRTSGREPVKRANQDASRWLVIADAILVDASQVKDVIPRMTEKTILDGGPPIECNRVCPPPQGELIGGEAGH